MPRTARFARVVVSAGVLLLTACGSATPSPAATSTPASTAMPSATSSPEVTPVPLLAPTEADLAAVEKLLYPASTAGSGDCLSGGGGPPSVLGCPLTQRLATAVSAALNDPNQGADPVCGCQAIDANQTVTYTLGTPPGGGTIHVTAFGSPHVAYVVIRSTGQLLVDDIVYCSPSPHSIYASETVTAC